MVFGPTKTHESRTVGIPSQVLSAFEDHLNEYVAAESDALVFTSPSGRVVNPNNFRRRVWKPAVIRCGLPEGLRIHDARHTSVSLLVNNGVPITSVMQHVGHRSISTTIDCYSHLYSEARLEATSALDAAISSARDPNSSVGGGQNADKVEPLMVSAS